MQATLAKIWDTMTQEQKYAVNTASEAEKNLLISAAAGSGKTFVLVQRIITLLLLHEKDIRKMLLATFTNAAAAQIQKRIQSALSALLYEEQIDSVHLKEQLMYLNGADISTLHAFCIKVIRNYFHVIDIAPDFMILQGTEEILLREETIRDVLEIFLAQQNEKFFRLYEMYTPVRSPLAMGEMVLEAYDYAMSRPEGLNWLAEEVQYYTDCTDLEKSKWIKFLVSAARQSLTEALNMQDKAIDCAAFVLPDEKTEILLREKEQIQVLLEALEKGLGWFQTTYRLQTQQRAVTLRFAKETDEEAKEEIKRYRKAARDLVKKEAAFLGAYSLKKAKRENEELYQALTVFLEVIKTFAAEYEKRKKKKKVITFHDCEQLCLRILAEESISREIKNQYEFIFIDEYQDISLLQEEILNRLSTGSNLFMVGDIKQSIYRFRLADADIFREKYERFQQEEAEGELIYLNKNFRSASGIINSVNAVFEAIMRKRTGGVDYDDNAKLVFARKDKEAAAKTEIHLMINQKQEEQDGEEDAVAELENAQFEATGTAHIIKKLLTEEIFDKKQQKMRKIEYGDIVVLLASPSADAAGYLEIFRQEKIPTFFDTGKDYFNHLEIDLMMNLLAIIDNDRQDMPLLAVMYSAVFGFTLSELLQIRQHEKKGFFHKAAKGYQEHFTDALSEKLCAMYDFISEFRKKSRQMRLHDLLLEIYATTGFYEYVSMLENGNVRRENLKSLLDIAREYEKGTMQGLFGFIRFVEKVKIAQNDLSAPSSFVQRQNAVRIMSIHKSKGLEFPVVILGRTAKRFNKADLRKELILHKYMGIGITYYDVEKGYKCDSLAKAAAKEAVKNEITSEQIRLLYVAMSRAEERLIVTGLIAEKTADRKMESWTEDISEYKVQKTNTFLDWIMSAVNRQGSKEIFKVIRHDGILTTTEDAEEIRRKAIYIFLSQGAEPLSEEELRYLHWRYPYEASTRIAQKITVSELKEMQRSPQKMYADFAAEEENNILPVRRGVIVHYILQTINLQVLKEAKNYASYIQAYIHQLLLEKVISAEEMCEIEIDKLAAFFASDIGQIILQAEKVDREVEFYFRANAKEVYQDERLLPHEYIYIQGVMDCVAIHKGIIYIIDYKTDRYRPEHRAERIELYGLQLNYYRMAYEEIMKTSHIKCVLSFINMGENIIIDETGKIDE